MERCKHTGEGRVKYALKALIPFNDLWRLIRRRDAYAGITGLSRTGIQIVVSQIIASTAQKQMSDGLAKGTIDGLNKVFGAAKGATTASAAASVILKTGEVGIRAATYNKILDKKIKETNEAIDFLKKKLKEYK